MGVGSVGIGSLVLIAAVCKDIVLVVRVGVFGVRGRCDGREFWI